MEKDTHVLDNNMVNVGEHSIGGVVAELSRSEGVEAAELAQHATLLGKLVVDERGDRG